MHNRFAFKFVAGAAIVSLVASALSAQDSTRTRTRSSRRIPITKEAPGEVVSRVDTVTVYRTDTLNLPGRVDTVSTTVTRVDTVVNTVYLQPRHFGGMYFGLAGGGALPYGAIRSVNQAGWLGQAQLGYQPLYGVLGFRGDVSLTQYAHTADYAYLGDRPMLWNANLDAKLSLPFFNHTLGSSVLMSPYLIGGGSYIAYKNHRRKLDTDAGVTGGIPPMNAVIASGDNASCSTPDCDTSYHSRWGWNAGGGLSFHAGRKEMFIEARAVHFNNGSEFAGSSWHVPVIFGVNLF
jgi:hypothetical protein